MNHIHISGECLPIGDRAFPVGHYSQWNDDYRIFVAMKDKRPNGDIHFYGELSKAKRPA